MIALLGLKPWEAEESVPRLEQPGFEVGVADAVAVPTVGPAVAVAEAAVSPGRATLVGRTGARPRKAQGEGSAPAVGPALAVAAPVGGETGPVPAPETSPVDPQPEAPPATTPAPELASVPTAPPSASPEAKTPGGPVPAGTPGFPGEEEGEETCAGDEYLLTIVLPEAEGEVATILLERIATDGSVETLELEGDLDDARVLVLQLSSEGGCVEVTVDEGDGAESPAAVPAAD